MLRYEVGVDRIVWGDHGPRPVGVARNRDEHLDLLRRDLRERFCDDDRYIRVYAFCLHVIDGGETPPDRVLEVVAYGSQAKLEECARDLWDHWVRG